MWATINEDNSIKEIINYPRAITVGQVRHPKDIFKTWTWEQLNEIGIYEVIDNGVKGQDFFEYTSQATYTFNADDDNVTTSYTITEKALSDSTDSDGVITYGLKHYAKEQAKRTANNLIKRFNWIVERFIYDSSKTIPTAISDYVSAIREYCGELETSIDNCDNIEDFKELYNDVEDSEGNITISKINRWENDDTIKEYLR